MLRSTLALLRRGHFTAVWQRVKKRIDSEYVAYGLRRDLTQPFDAPPAKVPIEIRPLETGDLAALLNIEDPGINGEEASLKLYQERIVEAQLPTCYVAVDASGQPCYMQWLLGAAQNERIQNHFQGILPRLAADEALMEGVYTPEAHRGQGIMPAAMARVAEKGLEMGVRWAIAFVGVTNVPSLKGCQRAGLKPYLLRTDRWRWFRHEIVFEPLPENAAYPWEAGHGSQAQVQRA